LAPSQFSAPSRAPPQRHPVMDARAETK
jgi:hypothetical protein